MEEKTFTEDPVYCKVDKITGEIKTLKVAVKKHVQDFFCMYMEAWDDFKDSEGYLKTVFIWCIMQSKYSNAGSENDGNVFHVSEVLDYISRKFPERNTTSVRNTISKLYKRGFIIKHNSIRGCYYINPKYGIKGNISENMFVDLTLKGEPITKLSLE